jgi:hypothetical protein
VCERSFVAYLKACNEALLQFVAFYWDELHPSLDYKLRSPFNSVVFETIRTQYVAAVRQERADIYQVAMNELRERGDVNIAAALSGWFDYFKPIILRATAPPEGEPPLPAAGEDAYPDSTPTPRRDQQHQHHDQHHHDQHHHDPNLNPDSNHDACPGTPVAHRSSDEGRTPATSVRMPESTTPIDQNVTSFRFSSFTSLGNVLEDYLYRSPSLKFIEQNYGPGVRKVTKGPGQHWRSKLYQSEHRRHSLNKECNKTSLTITLTMTLSLTLTRTLTLTNKECNKRVAIHEEIDRAVLEGRLTVRIDELNDMMVRV